MTPPIFCRFGFEGLNCLSGVLVDVSLPLPDAEFDGWLLCQ